MHWIDIVIIAIVALTTIIGLSKGLFESILSIFGTALSLFVAIWASKPVAAFVNNIVDVAEFAKKFLEEQGIAQNGNVAVPIAGNFPVETVANFVSTVIIVLGVFILIKFVIFLLSKLFDSATANSSALSGLNRLLGMVFGFAKGSLFVVLAFALTSVLTQVGLFTTTISDTISKTSSITQFAYNKVDEFTEEKFKEEIIKLLGDPTTEDVEEEEESETPPAENEENGEEETETP